MVSDWVEKFSVLTVVESEDTYNTVGGKRIKLTIYLRVFSRYSYYRKTAPMNIRYGPLQLAVCTTRLGLRVFITSQQTVL